jgi:hypothetical protein
MKSRSFAALLLLAPVAAYAQYTYRCTTVDGKKYYGATIPQQCVGQPIEQLSPSGTVMRRIDPEGDEKMRQAKEAEAAKRREEDVVAKEQSRRNRALLATYSSEKDIDEARERTLIENRKAIAEVEARIAEIKKRQAGYNKEMEFYAEGAAKPDAKKKSASAPQKAAPKAPPKLLDDVKNAEIDLAAQQNLLEVKQKEVVAINAKYDEDKNRYLELTGKDASSRAKALGMEKGVTVQSKPATSTYEQQRNQRDAQQRAAQEKYELDRIEREREMAQRGYRVR